MRVLSMPSWLDEQPVEIEFTVERGEVEARDAVLADGTHVHLDNWHRSQFENDVRPLILAAVIG